MGSVAWLAGTQNRRRSIGRSGHAHTVLAPAALGLGAYASLGLRGAFAYPVSQATSKVSRLSVWRYFYMISGPQ